MDKGALGREYASGDVICHQGEAGDRMYVIQAGEVEVLREVGKAEVLVGRKLETWDDIQAAAREIREMGVENVVIKGGHREEEKTSTDLLFDGQGFREYTASRVQTLSTHGTGCTFASAIAAALAKGETVPGAVAAAKAYVTKALQSAYPLGHGHGPVHHFYRFWRPIGD